MPWHIWTASRASTGRCCLTASVPRPPPNQPAVSRRAWVQLLTLAALWGAVYPLITIALRELTPVAVVFGRVALAALLLAPFAIHRDALRPLWKRPRAILATVLVQSTAPLLLLTFAQ